MSVPKNPGEALAARLTTGTDLIALVPLERITPNIPDAGQRNLASYLVFQRLSGGGSTGPDGSPPLDKRSGLKVFNYRFEAYAQTSEESEKILDAAMDRLCGNARNNIDVWRDLPNGVQGCFPVDDLSSDTLDDGSQVASQSVTLYFAPQV